MSRSINSFKQDEKNQKKTEKKNMKNHKVKRKA